MFTFPYCGNLRDKYNAFDDLLEQIPEGRYLVPSELHFKIFDILNSGFSSHTSRSTAEKWVEHLKKLMPYQQGYHTLEIQSELDWVIVSKLTHRGWQARGALGQGKVWDIRDHCVAPRETNIFQKEISRMGGLPEVLLSLDYENTVISRKMFKMKILGYKVGNWIYRSEEVFHQGQYANNWFMNAFR